MSRLERDQIFHDGYDSRGFEIPGLWIEDMMMRARTLKRFAGVAGGAMLAAAILFAGPAAADDIQYDGCIALDQQTKRGWYMSVFPASRSYDAGRAFGACLARQGVPAPAAACQASADFAGLNARMTAENKSLQGSGYDLSNMDAACLPGYRRRP